MGWFNKIKNVAKKVTRKAKKIVKPIKKKAKSIIQPVQKKVKKTYKNVDRAVGGYLPSGVTPKQARKDKEKTDRLKRQKKEEERKRKEIERKAKEREVSGMERVKNRLLGKDVQGSKGNEAEIKRKIETLENENKINRQLVEAGDKYEFLYPRQRQIEENEKEILRLEAGGDLDKSTKIKMGTTPDIGFGAGKSMIKKGGAMVKKADNLMDINSLRHDVARSSAATEAAADISLENRAILTNIAKAGRGAKKFGEASSKGGSGSRLGLTKLTGSRATGMQMGKFVSIPHNVKTVTQTKTWLAKIGSALKSPYAVAGALASAIGSYPFAGHEKAEALGMLSWGMGDALEAGDLVGAEAAKNLNKQMLDPNLWNQIIDKVPYANVMNQLTDLYHAAQIKSDIDNRILDDMKIKQETGETESEKWDRIFEERDAREEERRQETIEFEKSLIELRRKAKKEQRELDEKYWAKVRKENEARQKKDKQAEIKYWEEYQKRMQEIRAASAPSNLDFGLL